MLAKKYLCSFKIPTPVITFLIVHPLKGQGSSAHMRGATFQINPLAR